MSLFEWCSLRDALDYLTDKLKEEWTKDDVLDAGERNEFLVRTSLVRGNSGSIHYSYKVEIEKLKEYVARRLESNKSSLVDHSKIVPNWKMLVQSQAAVIWKRYKAMNCSPTKNNIKIDLAKWCRENNVVTKSGITPSEDYIYRHVLREWIPPTG